MHVYVGIYMYVCTTYHGTWYVVEVENITVAFR